MFQLRYPADLLQPAGYPETNPEFNPRVSPLVFVVGVWVIIVSVNLLPIRHFAQIGFVFRSVKILCLCLIIVFNVFRYIERPPEREAFWTWNSPHSFGSYNLPLHNGVFITGDGMWESITLSLFGLLGFETITIAAGEKKQGGGNKTVKLATSKTASRAIFLYILGTFTASLNFAHNCPLPSNKEAFSMASILGQLTGWPLFSNYFIAFTATTTGTMAIYNASRALHALANIQDVWPNSASRIRLRLASTTRSGVPQNSVIVCGLFGSLAGFAAVNTHSTEVG